MGKVFVALAVSVDGYITGRDPGAGHGLGDGTMLFDWYFDGDTASQVFDGFRLSEPSAQVAGPSPVSLTTTAGAAVLLPIVSPSPDDDFILS